MIKRSKPTPQQLKDWDETRAALMVFAPAFTHIFYTLMNKDDKYVAVFTDDTSQIPIAATDGSAIILNTTATGFFQFNLQERLFITCHEILHNVLNHIILLHNVQRSGKIMVSNGKLLPVNPIMLNAAMDYVINAILVDSKLGKLPAKGLWDVKIATSMESVLDVYEKLYRAALPPPPNKPGKQGNPGNQPPQPGNSPGNPPPQPGNQPPQPGNQPGQGSGQPGNNSSPGGFDTHLAPGTVDDINPHTAAAERNDAEWNTVIRAAMDAARTQGKLSGALARLFEEAIESKVDWTDLVKSWFARKVGSGSFTWKKPDRQLIVRDIWAPGRSGHGADLVVIACDTSGSISQKEVTLWCNVLGEILEQVRPKRIKVIWCDAEIGRVDEIEEASDLERIKKQGAPGGGGTSFVPVFDWIYEERLEPDALVYLTDGYGTFPREEPTYPVFWGSIALEASKYPFGEVVMVPPVTD